MDQSKKVVLVGHCGPDLHLLKAAVSRVVSGIPVELANDDAALQDFTSSDSVLLINRVLDGSFTTGSGIDLIQGLARGEAPPTMMLISNFEDAQTEAQKAGANEGFGKSSLYHERTAELLRQALE